MIKQSQDHIVFEIMDTSRLSMFQSSNTMSRLEEEQRGFSEETEKLSLEQKALREEQSRIEAERKKLQQEQYMLQQQQAIYLKIK